MLFLVPYGALQIIAMALSYVSTVLTMFRTFPVTQRSLIYQVALHENAIQGASHLGIPRTMPDRNGHPLHDRQR